MNYQPTLESLAAHPVPDWFCDAKFGTYPSLGAAMGSHDSGSGAPGLPSGRHPDQATASNLTRVESTLASTFSPGPRRNGGEGRRYFALARASRAPPHARCIDGPRRCTATSVPRGRTHGAAPPAPRSERRLVDLLPPTHTPPYKGETTAFEWSFPRRGAGAKPRALIVTFDTLESHGNLHTPVRAANVRVHGPVMRRPTSEEDTTRWFPPRAPPSCATGRGAKAACPVRRLLGAAMRRAAAALKRPGCPAGGIRISGNTEPHAC